MFSHRTVIRFIYCLLLLLAVISALALLVLLQSKSQVFVKPTISLTTPAEPVIPFPVSVNPKEETISEEEDPILYEDESLAVDRDDDNNGNWLQQILALFSQQDWYQNLASPVSRIVVIWPGQRKEEIAESIGDVLRWNDLERANFIEIINAMPPVLGEGKFYPGQYVAHREATPNEIATTINTEFNNKILNRYTPAVDAVVPLEEALTIASLLEREASDFENMREVSGVIWNRLFIDMPLQLDATLQYSKTNQVGAENWWPTPRPADKFIDSPYNTYKNNGLPPGPIASPSSDAVLAALNPLPTPCFYYFHDSNQDYYCSETYEEHVAKLKAAYGSGQ